MKATPSGVFPQDWRNEILTEASGGARARVISTELPIYRQPGPRKKYTRVQQKKRKAARKRARAARKRNRR